MKRNPLKRQPGQHKNKPKAKVKKRLLKNNEILTKLKKERQYVQTN